MSVVRTTDSTPKASTQCAHIPLPQPFSQQFPHTTSSMFTFNLTALHYRISWSRPKARNMNASYLATVSRQYVNLYLPRIQASPFNMYTRAPSANSGTFSFRVCPTFFFDWCSVRGEYHNRRQYKIEPRIRLQPRPSHPRWTRRSPARLTHSLSSGRLSSMRFSDRDTTLAFFTLDVSCS